MGVAAGAGDGSEARLGASACTPPPCGEHPHATRKIVAAPRITFLLAARVTERRRGKKGFLAQTGGSRGHYGDMFQL